MKTFTKDGNMIIMFDEQDNLLQESYWSIDRLKNAKPIGIYEPKGNIPEDKIEPIEPNLANKDSIPYKYGGKLFCHVPDNGDIAGSIQFCGHPRMAITAAHCVMDGNKGQWYENMIFKKKYPLEDTTFKILAVGVKEKWKKQDFDYDYAIVILDQNNEDGALEFSLKASKCMATSMGYPSNYYKGEEMMSVSAQIEIENSGKRAMMPGNPFAEGASGGAWIYDEKVIGVNSTKYKEEPVAKSPIFNEEFQSLYEFMKEYI